MVDQRRLLLLLGLGASQGLHVLPSCNFERGFANVDGRCSALRSASGAVTGRGRSARYLSTRLASSEPGRADDLGKFGERLVLEENWEQEEAQIIGLDDVDFEALAEEIAEEFSTAPAGAPVAAGGPGRGNGMAAPGSSGGVTMDRDLEDLLMEKSLRFYDPKLVGTRERCYLVGLEARGLSRGKNYGSNTGADGEDYAWDEEEQERLAAARQKAREDRFTLEESLGELSELAGTAGLEVVGSTYQRVLEPNPRTYIGSGKVKEIRRAMKALDCKTVILDEELSPGQQRSLETEFGGEEAGIKVLDRTALILDIFAQHARTKEGQLQVELALHTYRLPRLTKLWTHLERQTVRGGKGGGVGLRGPGERQLEVDRRLLKTKIAQLQRELGGVRRHRDIHRRRRVALGLPIVALVGYTNAGKSTLLNGLTRAGVLAEDMLFATLDPTTRRVRLPGLKVHPEVMLTDTVGFIQKLPTNLVAAFRATLEEVVEADVIIHVCDVSNPAWKKQESAVLKVLADLSKDEVDDEDVPGTAAISNSGRSGGIGGKPVVTFLNKIDLLPEAEQEQWQVDAAANHRFTAAGSARTRLGIEDLMAALEDALATLLHPVEAVVPFERGALLSGVHELGACDVEEYTDEGTLLRGRVPIELLNRLEPFFTDAFRRTPEGAFAAARATGAGRAAAAGAVSGGARDDSADLDFAALAKGRKQRR